jgi:3'-phosphoadenosine 5'-phosphosulfate sulfotransferase (PAPS reductase)/FAD synthetase
MSFLNISPCFTIDTSDNTLDDLRKKQFWPLDLKIAYSKALIHSFYRTCNKRVYVSFSGGKDSTVLLHLVRSIIPRVPAVFFDTGLEFPETRNFVKSKDNVVIIRPLLTFKQVIEKYGYPVGGKNVAHWVDLAQRGLPSGIKQMSSDSKYGYKKYNWLVDAPFRISERCCDALKKEPATRYYNETGQAPIIGTRVEESQIRTEVWLANGEINIQSKIPKCTPLSIWTDKDISDYIRRYDLDISEIYSKGYNRTGCAFCMFGIFADPNRFLLLKATHPKLWAYCMKDVSQGGLGMAEVLEFIGIDSGANQSLLSDFYSKARAKIINSTEIYSTGAGKDLPDGAGSNPSTLQPPHEVTE